MALLDKSPAAPVPTWIECGACPPEDGLGHREILYFVEGPAESAA